MNPADFISGGYPFGGSAIRIRQNSRRISASGFDPFQAWLATPVEAISSTGSTESLNIFLEIRSRVHNVYIQTNQQRAHLAKMLMFTIFKKNWN